MKKSNLIGRFLIPLIFFVCSTASITDATGQESQIDERVLEELEKKEGYVCPPCGHDCMQTLFEQAGTCDTCGMSLADTKKRC